MILLGYACVWKGDRTNEGDSVIPNGYASKADARQTAEKA